MIAEELKQLMELLKNMEDRGEIASFEEISERLGIGVQEVERLVDLLVITGKIEPELLGSTCEVSSACSKCPLRTVCPKSSPESTNVAAMRKFKLS